MLEDITRNRHRAVQDAARRFNCDHLPHGPIRQIAVEFGSFAENMLVKIPADDPEVTRGLGYLADAKDAFMRAQAFTRGSDGMNSGT